MLWRALLLVTVVPYLSVTFTLCWCTDTRGHTWEPQTRKDLDRHNLCLMCLGCAYVEKAYVDGLYPHCKNMTMARFKSQLSFLVRGQVTSAPSHPGPSIDRAESPGAYGILCGRKSVYTCCYNRHVQIRLEWHMQWAVSAVPSRAGTCWSRWTT